MATAKEVGSQNHPCKIVIVITHKRDGTPPKTLFPNLLDFLDLERIVKFPLVSAKTNLQVKKLS